MKLLHIALGTHQKAMIKAFDDHFKAKHYDWTQKQSTPHLINEDVLQIANEFMPEVIFMQLQTPDIITPETVKKLSEIGIVINWTGDVRHPIPDWYKQIGREIDLTMFTNTNDVLEFNKQGIPAQFLPIGFDPEINTPQGVRKEISPIVFCGSNYKTANPFPLSVYREQMVHTLTSRYKKDFTVFGSGWDRYQPKASFIDIDEEAIVYRSGLIGINLSHFNYGRYYSDRMIKMMGSGIFVLSHHYPSIEEDFTIGKHLDTWKNICELTEKIDYYLNNNEERERIAKLGCQYAHDNFTWNNVAIQLKKIIGIDE